MIDILKLSRKNKCHHFISRAYIETKFTPSSSLLHGLNEPITVSSVPLRSESASSVKFSQLPPRSASSTRLTAANSILKSSTTQWPPSNEIDNQNEFHPSSNASLTDDVRRMVCLFSLGSNSKIASFFLVFRIEVFSV